MEYKKFLNTQYCLRNFQHHILKKDVISIKSRSRSKKNVLLSYVTGPFLSADDSNVFQKHTNQWECFFFASFWLNCGYNVDIIDWDNSSFIPKKSYDIFIDIHSNMERLAPGLNENCKKILHITGAHWLYQNTAEYSRLLDVQARRGITLKPRRLAPPSLGIENADAATILGNDFTRGTFRYAEKPLFSLPLASMIEFDFNLNKDFNSCRNNFLWLGSSGMVHKGLDLVLEAFSQMPEFKLIICGPVHQETDFVGCYYKELFETRNIKTTGWTDVGSPEFSEIIANCTGLIYPSSSEGQAGSVITCLHAGLIPIISYQSGVDVDDFGVILENCTIEEICDKVAFVSDLPVAEVRMMSKKAWEYARKHHTRNNFAAAYERSIQNIVSI